MNISIIIGIVLGVGGILLGNAMEDGHVGTLLQGTAALIVIAGTAGATIVSSKMSDLKLSVTLLKAAFFDRAIDSRRSYAVQLTELSKLARKESILSIEKRVKDMKSPFMQKVMRYIVDGVDVKVLRDMFEDEISMEEEKLKNGAKVWSDAGGYSPTIGIIGAVLGLIHVMGNITNTAALGGGIAVAFVATIYGIGIANLVLLPIATHLKKNIEYEAESKQMILEGALGILEGMSPYLVEGKLQAYVDFPSQTTRGLFHEVVPTGD